MDYFHRKEGDLWCEDVPLSDLADRFGTPLYVYSKRTLTEHFRKLDQAFSDVPHLICYAVKANGTMAIVRALGRLGAGADVVSGGELHRALLAGIPPERIVYSGVGKTEAEIAAAVRAGIRSINVESAEELELLAEVARAVGHRQSCALRVNPDVDPEAHEYLTTGKAENKFGIPWKEAVTVAAMASNLPAVALEGVDFHLGSQILSPDPYRKALAQARQIVGDLRARGFHIRHLDVGGGLAARYDRERPMTADEFRDGIIELVRDLELTLVIEPGRFIMANAGVLLGRVQFVKQSAGKRFVILDAGMNDLIRPALYGAFHRIEPVREIQGEASPADVVGPICESADFLGKDRLLPPLARGDLLAVMTAGAYAAAMASNYTQRPRAAEVLVDGPEAALVRRRERYDDQLDLET